MSSTSFLLLALCLLLVGSAQAQIFPNVTGTISVSVTNKVSGDPFFGVGFPMEFTINGLHAPIMTLYIGVQYNFSISTTSIHPWYIGTDSTGEDQGFLYAGQTTGTFSWTPSTSDAAQTALYYECQNHPNMGNSIFLVNQPVQPSSAAPAATVSSSAAASSSPSTASPASSSPAPTSAVRASSSFPSSSTPSSSAVSSSVPQPTSAASSTPSTLSSSPAIAAGVSSSVTSAASQVSSSPASPSAPSSSLRASSSAPSSAAAASVVSSSAIAVSSTASPTSTPPSPTSTPVIPVTGITPTTTSIAVSVANKVAGDPFFNVGFPMEFTLNGLHAPNMTLYVGVQYNFSISTTSIHPWYIGTDPIGQGSGLLYAGQTTGTFLYTPSAADAARPALYYQCENHPSMGNSILLVAAPVSGSSSSAAAPAATSALASFTSPVGTGQPGNGAGKLMGRLEVAVGLVCALLFLWM